MDFYENNGVVQVCVYVCVCVLLCVCMRERERHNIMVCVYAHARMYWEPSAPFGCNWVAKNSGCLVGQIFARNEPCKYRLICGKKLDGEGLRRSLRQPVVNLVY